jgi:hypothetical protein
VSLAAVNLPMLLKNPPAHTQRYNPTSTSTLTSASASASASASGPGGWGANGSATTMASRETAKYYPSDQPRPAPQRQPLPPSEGVTPLPPPRSRTALLVRHGLRDHARVTVGEDSMPIVAPTSVSYWVNTQWEQSQNQQLKYLTRPDDSVE